MKTATRVLVVGVLAAALFLGVFVLSQGDTAEPAPLMPTQAKTDLREQPDLVVVGDEPLHRHAIVGEQELDENRLGEQKLGVSLATTDEATILVAVSTSNGLEVDLYPVVVWRGTVQAPHAGEEFRGRTGSDGLLAVVCPAGSYRVVGANGKFTDLHVGPGEHRQVSWIVAPARKVLGLVVDHQRMPLAGAQILQSIGSSHVGGTPLGESDRAGRFEVMVYEGSGSVLFARGHGFTPSLAQKTSGQDYVELVLDDLAVSVAGVVVGPGGDALPDVVLWTGHTAGVLYNASGSIKGLVPPQTIVRTGADGRFAIDVPNSFHRITARRSGYVAWSAALGGREIPIRHDSDTNRPLPITGIRIEMAIAEVVKGVVHGPDGRPVANAVVHFGRRGSDDYIRVIAGEDGRFEISGMPPGEHAIGAYTRVAGYTLKGKASVTCGAGVHGELTIEIQ